MASVVIYTRSWCSYCQAAKDLLRKKNIDFNEIDVEKTQGALQDMLAKASGRTSVPQIFIGTTHVGGCDDLYAAERAGKLDAMIAA